MPEWLVAKYVHSSARHKEDGWTDTHQTPITPRVVARRVRARAEKRMDASHAPATSSFKEKRAARRSVRGGGWPYLKNRTPGRRNARRFSGANTRTEKARRVQRVGGVGKTATTQEKVLGRRKQIVRTVQSGTIDPSAESWTSEKKGAGPSAS